jgi:hypothetical protein
MSTSVALCTGTALLCLALIWRITTASPRRPEPPSVVADDGWPALWIGQFSETQLGLSWEGYPPPAEAMAIRIERSPNGVTDWVQIAVVAPSVTCYLNGGLTPGTEYFYRVGALTPQGIAIPTNIASNRTVKPPPPPPFAERHAAAIRFVSWSSVPALALPLGLYVRRQQVRQRARRRGAAGMRAHCGYDLRATPGRCPECGMPAGRATPG